MKGNEKNNCPESEKNLILYLYGELPDPEAFEVHLAGCEKCRKELERFRGVLERYRDLPLGLDYIDVHQVVEELPHRSRFTFSENLIRPLVAFALAAAIVVAFILPLKLTEKQPKFEVTQKIEEPLDQLNSSLGEMFAGDNGEAESGSTSSGSLDELDGMMVELNDIYSDLREF